jgi:thioesterase domain-containing protein
MGWFRGGTVAIAIAIAIAATDKSVWEMDGR